jgi:hypothetical protein
VMLPVLTFEWPEEFGPPIVAGIFIGGCVDRGVGSSFRAQAHAHTVAAQDNLGWICVRSQRRLFTASGRVGRLLWHEFAHVITGHGHDDAWRSAMRALGQPITRQYRKQERRSQ